MIVTVVVGGVVWWNERGRTQMDGRQLFIARAEYNALQTKCVSLVILVWSALARCYAIFDPRLPYRSSIDVVVVVAVVVSTIARVLLRVAFPARDVDARIYRV